MPNGKFPTREQAIRGLGRVKPTPTKPALREPTREPTVEPEREARLYPWGRPPEDMGVGQNLIQQLLEFPLKGMEQTFNVIGAVLTAPYRAKALGELAEEFPVVSFLPGGRGYEQYLKWKVSPEAPTTSIPLPSWKQWGAWLKPLLKTDITLKALGIDVSKWEEPERYEWARWGLAEMAEIAPLLIMGGGAGKKPLEEALKIATKQIAKGKTPEVAINEAFNYLAKKKLMPKFAITPKVPKPPVEPVKPPITPKPEVPPVKPVAEARLAVPEVIFKSLEEADVAAIRAFNKMKATVGTGVHAELTSTEVEALRLYIKRYGDLTDRFLGVATRKWRDDIEITLGVFPEKVQRVTGGRYLGYDIKNNTFVVHSTPPSLEARVVGEVRGETVRGILTPEEFKSGVRDWITGKAPFPAERKRLALPKPPAVEVAKPPVEVPALPEVPPVKPPATITEAVEPMEAVSLKLADIVGKAKPVRKELEAIKSVELTKKIPAYAGLLNKAKTFTEAAMARGTLRGKLIPDAGDIIPIGEQFTPQEIALMIQKVNISETFAARPLTRGNIIDSLQRLLMDGKLPTETELEWLGKIFPELVEAIAKRAPISTKIWNAFLEIYNLPRAVLASGDASATLRQMIILAPRYPISAARSTLVGLRAGWSTLWYRDYAITVDKAIHASRFVEKRDIARLYIAPLTGAVRMTKREEAYMSSVLSRLGRDWPQYSLLKKIVTAPALPLAKLTQVSEAIFITTLNKMRADIFDRYALLWGEKASMAELRSLAEVINIGTGRGVMPRWLEGMAPFLNTILFSPRLQIARVQALSWPVTLWRYPPKVRRMVIGNIVAMIGTISSILGVMELGKIGTVEKDTRSADFGKIRIGNTRLDPWGGFQQWVVLINRLLSGEMKTAGKRIVDIDREDTLIRFLGMKLSPALGFMRDVFRGETFLGEELTLETEDVKKQAYERLVPMFTRDVIDAIREDGWVGGLAASPGFLGVGIVSYPSRTFADWLTYIQETTGKEWTTEEMLAVRPDFNKAEVDWLEYFELPTGRMREQYRRDNPEIEANLYFWGEVKQLLNPESEPFLKALLDKHKLNRDLFPVREVFEVYDPSDKTDEEIFGDFVNLVPRWWADHVFEFEAEWRRAYLPGYIDSIKQLKDADTALINQYYAETRDKDTTFKMEYRKNRPDTDAALVFWRGFVSLRSTQAYNSLTLRMKAYGLPMMLLPTLSEAMPKPKKGRFPTREQAIRMR